MAALRDRSAWLQGGNALCLQPPPEAWRTWRLVLLGPPGVGKGTQAHLLSSALGACPLSTGDIFRAAHSYESPPGTAMGEARARIDRGELVPDDVVLGLIRDRRKCLRCRGGFMLDGFPRTMPQAISLDAMLAADRVELDAVLNYEIPVEQLEERVSGRLICRRCHAVYHARNHPPRQSGVCDRCGETLEQRKDDEPEAVRTRLHAYLATTEAVAAHYSRRGLVISIRATGNPSEILASTLVALSHRGFASQR